MTTAETEHPRSTDMPDEQTRRCPHLRNDPDDGYCWACGMWLGRIGDAERKPSTDA